MSSRSITSLLAALALLGACSDDGDDSTATTQPGTTGVTTTAIETTVVTTTEVTTTAIETTVPDGLEQPAIWPAADVVFDTPEAAAQDFVSNVFGDGPTIGEYRAGDNRSGEIDVILPSESGGSGTVRSMLLMRQLGPDDGWFVLAAVNDYAAVGTPPQGAQVDAGLLEVSGTGRGFEATIIVWAFLPGNAEPIDREVTMAGTMDTAGPFTVNLDFSGVSSGSTVVLMVQGTTGLETDPGEFGAIPVVIS